MTYVAALIVGMLGGVLVSWGLAARRAAAAEATMAALREQRDKNEGEIKTLRESLREEQNARSAAQATLEAEGRNLEEQRNLLRDAESKLREAFTALSTDVLTRQSASFLQLAVEKFSVLRAQADGDLATRQLAIDSLVQPLKDSLDKYNIQVQAMEAARAGAFGHLEAELKSLTAASEKLSNALRGGPQVRGKWGEMTLRRAAELAGMSVHCDFNEQETLISEAGRSRPDMIVNLPGGHRVPVDAKVPLQAFLDASSAVSDAERSAHLQRHSQLLRSHMIQLAGKSYWEQFDPGVEIVLMFLPGEAFLAAAAAEDRTLIEDAIARKVFIVTPTTLIGLLRGVAYGWRQEQIAQNAREISNCGKDLYDRIRTFVNHFDGIRTGLDEAVTSYNKATGSLESRVLVAARRFKELGAAAGEDIPEVRCVEEAPRGFGARDSQDSLPLDGIEEGSNGRPSEGGHQPGGGR